MMEEKGYTPADRDWMSRALSLAAQAAEVGEVPVGAILVKNGAVIGEGWNRPISSCDPTAHAEVVALRDAASRLENYRLPETTLYVTIEPCTMCVGAILHGRVGRLVYGATEPRAGAVTSQLRLTEMTHYNHKIDVVGGVMAKECSQLMSEFFKKKRQINLIKKL
tara:strand:- start:33625 stop:34119 length:495 start_codon:yes stop_codon:yes gene_type:complete